MKLKIPKSKMFFTVNTNTNKLEVSHFKSPCMEICFNEIKRQFLKFPKNITKIVSILTFQY